jgi:hypothetical protein
MAERLAPDGQRRTSKGDLIPEQRDSEILVVINARMSCEESDKLSWELVEQEKKKREDARTYRKRTWWFDEGKHYQLWSPLETEPASLGDALSAAVKSVPRSRRQKNKES